MPETKTVKISAGSDFHGKNAAPVSNKHDAFWNRAHQGGALMPVRFHATNNEKGPLEEIIFIRQSISNPV